MNIPRILTGLGDVPSLIQMAHAASQPITVILGVRRREAGALLPPDPDLWDPSRSWADSNRLYLGLFDPDIPSKARAFGRFPATLTLVPGDLAGLRGAVEKPFADEVISLGVFGYRDLRLPVVHDLAAILLPEASLRLYLTMENDSANLGSLELKFRLAGFEDVTREVVNPPEKPMGGPPPQRPRLAWPTSLQSLIRCRRSKSSAPTSPRPARNEKAPPPSRSPSWTPFDLALLAEKIAGELEENGPLRANDLWTRLSRETGLQKPFLREHFSVVVSAVLWRHWGSLSEHTRSRLKDRLRQGTVEGGWPELEALRGIGYEPPYRYLPPPEQQVVLRRELERLLASSHPPIPFRETVEVIQTGLREQGIEIDLTGLEGTLHHFPDLLWDAVDRGVLNGRFLDMKGIRRQQIPSEPPPAPEPPAALKALPSPPVVRAPAPDPREVSQAAIDRFLAGRHRRRRKRP